MDQTQQNGKTVGSNGDGMMRNQADASQDRERLMNDLRSAIGDAELWLSNIGSQGSADLGHIKSKFDDTLRTAKTDLLKLEDTMVARGKIAAQATDVYVKDNPWTSVGMGAAIGLALGYLIARK